MCRDTDRLHHRSYGRSGSFFKPLVAGDQKASLASLSLPLSVQALAGLPCLGSFSIVRHVGHIEGPPGWGPTLQFSGEAFDGPAYLLFSCRCCRLGRERLWCWLYTLRVTQQYRLLPWLPGFPPQAFPTTVFPHIPLICLSTVNSGPRPGIAPLSLNSSSQLLHLLGDLHPCPGYVWLQQGLSDSHSI